MLLELTTKEAVLLVESLSRDIQTLRQTGHEEDVPYLKNVLQNLRNEFVDILAPVPATKEQVDRYVEAQMSKIEKMKLELDNSGGEKVSTPR